MKRLKFLPSVLMLVLCVGVLCMGIYAASPNSNQITGSITINPANAAVDISVWTEDWQGNQTSTPQVVNNLRAGNHKFTLNSGLTLDFSTVNAINEVKPCYIKIQITNKSQKELGAYISNSPMTQQVTKLDVFTTAPMVNNNSVTATSVVFYAHMGVATASEADLTDTTTIILEFRANAFIETATPISFDNYHVNIEEYQSNIATTPVNATLLNEINGFVKLPSSIATIDNTTGFQRLTAESLSASITDGLWVVIPNGVTNLGGVMGPQAAFMGCKALTRVSLPNSLTAINSACFSGCENLSSVVIPNGDVYGSSVFNGCSNLVRVIMLDGVRVTGTLIFERCINLTSMSILTSASIDPTTFFDGPVFSVGASNTQYSNDEQGGLYNKNKTKLICVPNVQSFVIPNSVTAIVASGISNCTALTQLKYTGTMTEFNAIQGKANILSYYSVICSDGTIAKTA